jgi:rubrerythrin
MAESDRTRDRPNRTPLDTEVWLCPQCRTRGDLVPEADGVLLRCAECGFVSRGKPAPNFDVE